MMMTVCLMKRIPVMNLVAVAEDERVKPVLLHTLMLGPPLSTRQLIDPTVLHMLTSAFLAIQLDMLSLMLCRIPGIVSTCTKWCVILAPTCKWLTHQFLNDPAHDTCKNVPSSVDNHCVAFCLQNSQNVFLSFFFVYLFS